MERLRRITRFWNWLPAFRAVAECTHLPTASRELCVTAPALSRAVRLLEKDLDAQLFRRVGRRLELNESGRQFLDAVREGMRLVHEAVLHVKNEQLIGPVRIASVGPISTTVLAPALEVLRRLHPRLTPVVTTRQADELAPMLHRGLVDIAFHGPVGGLEGFRTVSLGVATSAVYCGPGHPLHGKRRVRPEQILEHPFVAMPLDATGRCVDGWPIDLPRQVAVQVDELRVCLELCMRGRLLTVLPDRLVGSLPFGRSQADSPWRLPFGGIAETPLLGTQRPQLGFTTRGEVVLEAVREALLGVDRTQGKQGKRGGLRRELG
jgi:DNA-binding transcriptional LysR family regulator